MNPLFRPVAVLSVVSVIFGLGLGACSQHQELSATPAPVGAVSAKVHAMRAMPGFFPIYWDDKAGKLWLEVTHLDTDFLYFTSLPGGMGSNDIGLDRNQPGPHRVVRFIRSGPRLLLVEQNTRFRAEHGSAEEKQAVRDSFASSVLAGFDVGVEEKDRLLVDATDFFLRDAHDVIGALAENKQGAFKLDPKRSAFFLPNTRNFPINTEVEVILTFGGDAPGKFVKDVTPDPHSITVREHHTFVQLPEPGFTPRAFDPRAGYFNVSFADYAAPMGQPLAKRLMTRHRLIKKDPAAAVSDPVKPIVYYLDPATPEPIRSALLDGARWWAQAFEAAGFSNAFKVEVLPAGVDPMDARYNIISWVHRATRGWSYGAAIVDPRTGEIIKGSVTLGSLRMRQDYMIAEGLLAPYEEGKPASPEIERFVLSRLRQLAAHEVGHTLGLAHNYLSSALGAGRTSVMDYPFPLLSLKPDGTVDTSQGYAVGIGEWDKVAINAGYHQFAAGADEVAGVADILAEGRKRGLSFLTDQDARPLGSVHPQVHLWDNGANAVDELNRLLAVRKAALDRFGENVIATGRPLATLEEPLVTTYLLHRYQIEAAAKSIGGATYSYAVRGDGQTPITPVPGDEQRRALNALLDALQPSVLKLPDSLVKLIPPRPSGFPATRELFARKTGLTFDALAPAEAAADITCSLLFEPTRASRLVEQAAMDSSLPSLREVLGRICDRLIDVNFGSGMEAEIHRTVAYVTVTRLIALAANPETLPQVKADATVELGWIHDRVGTGRGNGHAYENYLARLISQYLDHPKEFEPLPTAVTPPGQPIGSAMDDDFEAPDAR